MKIKERAFVLLSTCLLTFNFALAADQGTLQVTSITPTQTLATPNGNFDNGWEWIFNVTVPANETVVKMKFADWTSGTSTIATANNVRFFSPQSINANSTSTAKTLTDNSYGDAIILNPNLDLSTQTVGRQIQIVVQVRVPAGTGGGNYTSSYGIRSDLDPNQPVGSIDYGLYPEYATAGVNGVTTDRIVGQVQVNVTNESIKLNTLKITPTFISGSSTNPLFIGLKNFKLFMNNTQIGATNNWEVQNGTTSFLYNLGPDTILPIGATNFSVISDFDFYPSRLFSTSTLLLTFNGLTNNGQGVNTNRLISVFPNDLNIATTSLTNLIPLDDLAQIDFSNISNPGTSSVGVGATSTVLWAGNIYISKNPVNIMYIPFKMIGNTSFESLKNVKLCIDDGCNSYFRYATDSKEFIEFEPMGRYVSAGTHTLQLKGDIVSGANTSFYISLENSDDRIISMADDTFNLDGEVTLNGNPFTKIDGPTINIVNTVSGGGGGGGGGGFVVSTSTISTTTSVNIIPGFMLDSNVNVPTQNQTLWSENVSVLGGVANFNKLKLKMLGSAPTNTISAFTLYIDGVAKVSSALDTNSYINFDLGSGVNLVQGSHVIEVRGDIVAGADRSFYINLMQADDVLFSDATFHKINPTANMSPNFVNLFGPTFFINSASLTIMQDQSFNNTATLIPGSSQVKLAAFKYTAYNEDTKINYLTFVPNLSGLVGGTNISNVALFVNGTQVGSNISQVNDGATFTFAGLGNNLYIPAGQTVTVEIRGDILSSLGFPITSGTISMNLLSGSGSAQAISSGKIFSTPACAGQTLSIAPNNVVFGATAGFSASTKSPNSTQVKIGSFTLQDGQAEAISVNQIVINLTGTMVASNQLTNLTIKDSSNGSVLATPIGNPTTTNNFTTNVSVPENSTKIFDVYADLGSASAGLTVTPVMSVAYRGATTNLSSTTGTVVGAVTTSGVATITANNVTFNSGLSPVSQFVIGGINNFNIGTFNFKVNNNIAGATIQDITFSVPANTISSITVNGKSSSVIGNTATIFGANIAVPGDSSGVNIPVNVSLTCVGVSNGCAQNSPASTSVALSSFTYNNGSAVVSVTGVNAITNSFSVVGSKPTLTVNSIQATGFVLGAENKIGEVTISADAAGNIKLNQIAFIVNIVGGSNPSVTGMRLVSGGTTVQGTSCTSGFICSFPDNYILQAGTSQTFSLYATVNGNSISASGSSLVPQNFRWSDVVGGGANLDGTQIYNFPTNSYSIRQ